MKERLHPQASSYGFKDFEKFFARFQSITKNPELHYLSDAIFQLLLPREPGVEKRFKGGLIVWTLWVLQKLIGTQNAQDKKASSIPDSTSSLTYGFRLLQTPAHHDSLAPILEQISREQRTLYGFGWEGADDGEQTKASGLLQNLSRLRRRESLAALWHAIRTSRTIRHILSLMSGDSQKNIPADFTSRMAELVFRQQLELAVLRPTPCPHRALFLTYELIPESKAWVQWAREAGCRVIHVMHGQWLPAYQITMTTELLLFSKVDEPWFRKRVAPNVKLWTIGHPRLETIRREVGPPAKFRRDSLPKIAFFSQPSESDYSRELRLNDWRILCGLKGRADVRFRLHPREDRETAIRDLKEIGADFIELSDAGLKEDLTWCDAVASSWSTVSMEAAACDRGVFWTCSTPEKYEASRELQNAGIGAVIQHPNDWNAHLEAWASAGWQEPVTIPEHRLHELGMIGDMDSPWLERLGIE